MFKKIGMYHELKTMLILTTSKTLSEGMCALYYLLFTYVNSNLLFTNNFLHQMLGIYVQTAGATQIHVQEQNRLIQLSPSVTSVPKDNMLFGRENREPPKESLTHIS